MFVVARHESLTLLKKRPFHDQKDIAVEATQKEPGFGPAGAIRPARSHVTSCVAKNVADPGWSERNHRSFEKIFLLFLADRLSHILK